MKDVHDVVKQLKNLLIKRSNTAHGSLTMKELSDDDDDDLDDDTKAKKKASGDDDDDENDYVHRDPGMMPGQIRIARNLECMGKAS